MDLPVAVALGMVVLGMLGIALVLIGRTLGHLIDAVNALVRAQCSLTAVIARRLHIGGLSDEDVHDGEA